LKSKSNITSRAPAPKSLSSKSAHTSRDHGNGRSVISCNTRLPWSSSALNGGNCNVLWSIPRKTKSRGGVVLRPSRRSKSSKLCSPRHGTEINGTLGKKCPTKISPVQKRQISVSTNNRARPDQCMRDYTRTTENSRRLVDLAPPPSWAEQSGTRRSFVIQNAFVI